MRKVIGLIFGFALLGGVADAAAQEYRALTRFNHGAYMGIRYKSERVISSDREQNKTSIVIDDVSKGSPAEKAGLRAGDEILRINGLSAGGGKFEAVASTLVEGDTVKLRVKRGNKEQEHTLIAAARPDHYVSMLDDRTFMFSADSVRGLMKMYLDSARVHLDSLHLPNVWVHRG
ncbi:MAG TPA: PDZ domain-containing protein, partial [Hyphomicrobiaceae bacterium]